MITSFLGHDMMPEAEDLVFPWNLLILQFCTTSFKKMFYNPTSQKTQKFFIIKLWATADNDEFILPTFQLF